MGALEETISLLENALEEDEQFEEAIRFAKSGEAKMTIPEGQEERRRLLRDLIRMMAADGELASVEKQLFAEAAARMGIKPDELEKTIDELI